MIVKMRIDDRLLHGQVAYSWKSALSYEAIVIANDSAANDNMRKTAIKLSCPAGVHLAVRTVKEAAELLKNAKLKNMKVFVICANPKDAYSLLNLIEERPTLNLGGMQKNEGKEAFSPAVFVSKEDIEYLDKILEMNVNIEVRQVPSEAAKDYKALRKK